MKKDVAKRIDGLAEALFIRGRGRSRHSRAFYRRIARRALAYIEGWALSRAADTRADQYPNTRTTLQTSVRSTPARKKR